VLNTVLPEDRDFMKDDVKAIDGLEGNEIERKGKRSTINRFTAFRICKSVHYRTF
jgi:hypothetical protein